MRNLGLRGWFPSPSRWLRCGNGCTQLGWLRNPLMCPSRCVLNDLAAPSHWVRQGSSTAEMMYRLTSAD
jgi:hypothetical protein